MSMNTRPALLGGLLPGRPGVFKAASLLGLID